MIRVPLVARLSYYVYVSGNFTFQWEGDYNAYTVHIQSDDNNIIPDNITE